MMTMMAFAMVVMNKHHMSEVTNQVLSIGGDDDGISVMVMMAMMMVHIDSGGHGGVSDLADGTVVATMQG